MIWKRQSSIEIIKIALVILIFVWLLGGIGKKVTEGELENSPFWLLFEQSLDEALKHSVLVLPAFEEKEENQRGLAGLIEAAVQKELPLQDFLATSGSREGDALKEGSDEDYKSLGKSGLDYDENALHIEDSLMEQLQKENRRYAERIKEPVEKNGELAQTDPTGERSADSGSEFVKAAMPAYSYDWSKEWGYDELVSNFYAIDNTTELKEEYVSLDKLLNRDLTIEKSAGEEDLPRILIYHTHSQEAFADSVPGDASTTIVGAGERLAELLREEYGFSVLHHTGEYDVENRDYAYSNSLPAIEALLEQYPSIEVVIDLHRDAVAEDEKLLMDLQGRPTARLMFFNGMSYSKGKGEIDYLENPYIEENLAFSFQAQVAANEYYPGIARRIYLKAYRYNMHLRAKTLLVELGAQTNTVEEIRNACAPLAHIIAIVLSKEL